MSDKQLLFASSHVFQGATPLDCIHQCDIDLKTRQVTAEEVSDLLKRWLVFVTQPVKENIRDDLVSFVHNCFMAFPAELLDSYAAFLEKAYSTILCLECTIFIEIALVHAGQTIDRSFADKTLHEFEQLLAQKTDKVCGLTIDEKEALFCIHHLLRIFPVTEPQLTPFVKALFPEDAMDFRIDLVAKIAEARLLHLIPEKYYTSLRAFENSLCPAQAFVELLPLLPEQSFMSVAKDLESFVIAQHDHRVTIVYVTKCIETGFKDVKEAKELADTLKACDINESVINFFRPLDFVFSEDVALEVSDFSDTEFWITTLEQPQKYLTDEQIKDFFEKCSDPVILGRALKPLFTHPCLTEAATWHKILQILRREDYKSCGKCFVANSLDVGEFAIQLLLFEQPFSDNTAEFLRMALSTKALKDQFVSSAMLGKLLSSIDKQPCFSFWRLFSKSRVLIEFAVENKLRCHYVMYGLVTVTSFTKLDPNLQTLYIEEQTEESLEAMFAYFERSFVDKATLFKSIDGKGPELSLMTAGHYFGTRLAYNQQPAEYEGLNPRNILHFVIVACITYSVTTRLHAAPVLLSVFTNDKYYPMITEAVFLPNNKIVGKFSQTILLAMPTLYLFNTFEEKLRPIVLRVFKENVFDPKRMSLFLIHMSVSTASPTSFVRRSMIKDEGYVRNANNEPTKANIEEIRAQERQFWDEIGEQAVEFLMKQKFEDDDYPQKFHCDCLRDKEILNRKINENPTPEAIVFVQEFTQAAPEPKIDDPKPILKLLDECIEKKDIVNSRVIIRYLAKTAFSKELLPYFKLDLHPTVILALTSMFKSDDIQSVRENVQVDFVIDLMSQKQRILDPKMRYFVERLLSDDDTLLHCYMHSLEGIKRSFCLTTHTVASLNWDEIKRKPEVFARAVHALYVSPEAAKSVLLRRAKRLPVPLPSPFSVSVAEKMMTEALKRRSVALMSWIALFLRSHPFLFVNLDCYFVFENIMSLLCDFMESKTGRRFQLWVVVVTILHAYVSIPRIADKFFEWFFAYRNVFNDHQIYAVLLLIHSFLKVPSVRNAMAATMYRYHWTTFVTTDRTAKEFATVTQLYLKVLEESAEFPNEFVVISQCETPFDRTFDGVLSIGRLLVDQDPMKYVLETLSEEDSGFVNKIVRDRLFKRESESAEARLLEEQLAKLPEPEPDYSWVPDTIDKRALAELPQKWVSTILHHKLPPIPDKLTDDMMKYLTFLPQWVSCYVQNPSTLLLLPEHYKEIYQAIETLGKIAKGESPVKLGGYSSRDIPVPTIDFKPQPIHHAVDISFTSTSLAFRPDIEERSKRVVPDDELDESEKHAEGSFHPKEVDSFKLSENELVDEKTGLVYVELKDCSFTDIVKSLFETRSLFNTLIHMAKMLPESAEYFDELLQTVAVFGRQGAVTMFDKMCPLLLPTIDNLTAATRILVGLAKSEEFAKLIDQQMIDKILATVFRPQFRMSRKILQQTSQFIGKLTGAPVRSIHLINLMLLSNDNKCLTEAFIPYSKLSEDERQSVMPSIKVALDTMLQKSIEADVACDSILTALQLLPELVEPRRDKFLIILKKLLQRYDPSNNLLLGHLFKVLTPPLDQLVKSDTQELPQQVVAQAPEFWQTVVDYRTCISKIIGDDVSYLNEYFQFCNVYPFLLEFPLKFRMLQDTLKREHTMRIRRIIVSRENVLQDSFTALSMIDKATWQGEISVNFVGEPAVDMGGVRKEWMTLLVRALFNPEYAFFTAERVPNPASGINPNHLKYFEFAGKIIAKAVHENINVDCHLPVFMYKEILGAKIGLSDFEGDPTYQSLVWILNNDPEELDMRFVADREELGQHIEVPLIPNGDEVVVTNENKKEFVELFVRHRLVGQAEKQIESFVRGFNEIISRDKLKMFTPRELDLVICGIPSVDVRDMRQHCHYMYPLSAGHPVVQRFFAVIRHWGKEDLAKLLVFITGSSQVPVGGFRAFAQMGQPFTLAAGGDWNRLPAAHTCSNTLDLPAYRSEREMNEKLHFAISECNEFGFA